ncbi:hypothetical protein [Devosia sediminis]|uniref:DUF995 domain-containing protein n=1 Tax=Devosia sediminis TaxID=2798801 RepID=A0A934MM24_9HYPH|nr:hypothetical protein [Devosia sediminis]MBJ3785251.1 hypothetical protein [Devosia sediminis]
MLQRSVFVFLAAMLVFMQPVLAQSSSQAEEQAKWEDFFVGKTLISFDEGHGTQVYFMGEDRHSYLFYPGNRVVLRGDFEFHWRGGRPVLCFRYGANTYNPSTGEMGGNWACRAAEGWARNVTERATGDPLGLSRRRQVPFVLSAERTSFEELMQLAR